MGRPPASTDKSQPRKMAFGGGYRRAIMPNPYMRKSLAWLLVANALRKEPLNFAQLSAYAGHPPKSIEGAFTRLTQKGLFKPDGTINFDSPFYSSLSPPPAPLADLKHAVSLVADLDEETNPTAEPELEGLTPERAITLLTRWVEGGAAGKDAPKFISQIMELRRLVGKVAGPPEPRSDAEVLTRLVAILDSVPPDLLTIALERVHDLQAARGALKGPPQASPSPANQGQEPSGPSGLRPPDHLPEPTPRGPIGDPPS